MAADIKHMLDLDLLSKPQITSVLDSALVYKDILNSDMKKQDELRGKIVVTLFYEASTRTRMSFEEAGKILGSDVINVSASGSSVEKGESLVNTAKTIEAMNVDAVVIRHPHSGAPYILADQFASASVVNAGDGTHAHPTQALLDLFTVLEHVDSIEGLKIAIVGDVIHSRVARSNIHGFLKLGAHVFLAGPATLLPKAMPWLRYYESEGSLSMTTNVDEALKDADVVMTLRLQNERQISGYIPSEREYIANWKINSSRIDKNCPDAWIMHPGPMNEGIEISESIANGPKSLIQKQVENGVVIRMAVLSHVCGVKHNK
ncbi:MAG: Aspartate carbamoyltransferase [Chloroflexota bacterium]|nr:MAG: Aspartate carbamoyltransferase [Chloroflexota bacterium]